MKSRTAHFVNFVNCFLIVLVNFFSMIYRRHDPHGAQNGGAGLTDAEREAATAKAESVMQVARQQNLTGDSGTRDDFARKLYLGLKGGKKRRADYYSMDAVDAERQREQQQLLQEDESTSEDEYRVVIESSKKETKIKETKNRKQKALRKSSNRRRDDDGSSVRDSDESEYERRRSKHRKHKKKRKYRKHSHSKDESGDSDDDSGRDPRRGENHRKSKKSRKEEPLRESFVAAEQYTGSKSGYVFKSGDKGVGYYQDTGTKVFPSLSP